MLSRRHLRIKVMQALYGYYQADADNIPAYEKELLKSIYKTEEVAKAIEKDNPKMDMGKKMAIASDIAKRVAERISAGK